MLDDLCDRFWQNTYLRHFLLTWVQNGPVGFEKTLHTKKQSIQCIMTVLCQGNLKQQIEKLLRYVLYTTTNSSEDKA